MMPGEQMSHWGTNLAVKGEDVILEGMKGNYSNTVGIYVWF